MAKPAQKYRSPEKKGGKQAGKQEGKRKWSKGARNIAALLPRELRDNFGRRGFSQREILTRWPDIVGPELAAECSPEKLLFDRTSNREGTLHLRVSGVSALEIQHQQPLILERINAFYGYRAVARVVLKQAPLPPVATAVQPSPVGLSDIEQESVDQATGNLANNDLRQALARLGQSIISDHKTR